MNRLAKNFILGSLLIAISTFQTSCTAPEVGAVVGGIAGAAIGGHNHGTGGAIVGAIVGGLAGAMIGKLAEDEFYFDQHGHRHSYRVSTYEVREVRYSHTPPSYYYHWTSYQTSPHQYYWRDEYIYVPRYGRQMTTRRWYRGETCVRQYYVVGMYDSMKANGALEALDPNVVENVERSSDNLGLPLKTTQALQARLYEALLTETGKPVMDIFKDDFKWAERKALKKGFESGSLEANSDVLNKVASSLSRLAGEEISREMADTFLKASLKAARGDF